MTQPLMPMATAVWLVDNTTLTFKQIARFCGLHELEVQGIADETVGLHIVGLDPTLNAQLTHEEIERCQADGSADLQILEDEVPAQPRTKGPRYTPVSKRQDKPDAIAWMLRNHPEVSDAQVSKLVGTTKPTIQALRDRSHWNIQNIKPLDPVALGLCSQIELDEAVLKAAKKVEAQMAKEEKAAAKAAKAQATKLEAAEEESEVASEPAEEAPAEQVTEEVQAAVLEEKTEAAEAEPVADTGAEVGTNTGADAGAVAEDDTGAETPAGEEAVSVTAAEESGTLTP